MICTPHLGASTEQAQINVVDRRGASRSATSCSKGVVRNAVNLPSISAEALEQVRPYLMLGEKLGRFQGQLCPGAVEEIEIEYAGEIAELRVAPVTIAVLKGLLESVRDHVNMVNAPVVAQQHGIKVVESKASRAQDFASTITTRVRGSADRLIAGADLPRRPAAHRARRRLHARGDSRGPDHPDATTTTGRASWGRWARCSARPASTSRACSSGWCAERGEAAMLVNVSPLPSDSVMERLRNLPNVITAQLVDLGP